MTDFLAELEQQMTEAAHRAAAERARPPRVKRWPTVAFVAAAAVAIAGMFLLPQPSRERAPAKPPFVSLKGTTIGHYNAANIQGLASAAGVAIRRHGPIADVNATPGAMKHSVVLADRAHAAQARRIARVLGIERFGPPRDLRDGQAYDVTVLLGEDFARPAPRLLASFAFLRESPNRPIFTTAGTARVIASRTGVCLQIHDGAGWGGTCADVTDALAGKLVVSGRAENGRLRGAVGLVPDGIDAVELDGGTRRIPVLRNLWAIGPDNVSTVTVGGVTLDVP
jgi:hypothetical protein